MYATHGNEVTSLSINLVLFLLFLEFELYVSVIFLLFIILIISATNRVLVES